MNRDEWEILREGWEFEAKLAQGKDGRGEVPASFWDTYSAFANTAGGIIVLGMAERKDGSLDVRGIRDLDKVERDLWNALHDPQKVSANVKLRQVSLLPEESVAAVRGRLGKQFAELDELGRLIAVTADAEAGLTHARAAGLTNAHPRDVTLKLQDLIRKGVLVASGPARTRWYALSEKARRRSGQVESSRIRRSGQSARSSGQSSRSSGQTPRNSGQNVRTAQKGVKSFASSTREGVAARRSSGQSHTSSGQSPRSFGQSSWVRASEQEERLLAYCKRAWRTLAEIASHLDRAEETVRKHYLPRLVESGALIRRYPSPNDPRQAYRTASTHR